LNSGATVRGFLGITPLLCVLLFLPLVQASQQTAQSQPDQGNLEKYGPPVPDPAEISFAFERPGLSVPSYTMTISTIAGRYEGTEVSQSERSSTTAPPPQPFKQNFTISLATAHKIVALAHSLNNFNVECSSKAKNIADTGKKTLRYFGHPDPWQGSCTYNYTENKDVQALTLIFQGIAETMDQGRNLDFLRRFDRLGLDAAVTFLAQEVSEGRALELGTIAPSLRAIVEDAEVMQRVRTKAATLLAGIPADAHQSGP
jgi:hypothetical protein